MKIHLRDDIRSRDLLEWLVETGADVQSFEEARTPLEEMAEEEENRVIEILLSSVKSGQLVVGKILGLGSAALLSINP